MQEQPSGSGVTYAGGGLTLRTKGDDAFIEQDGQPAYSDCKGTRA